MQINDNLHAFLWRSMTANNCNCFLIDGPKRILIDPGHIQLFDHVQRGLGDVGLKLEDIDLVLCTHAHPDHIEAVPLLKQAGAKFGLHTEDWELAKAHGPHFNLSMGPRLEDFQPDFFLQEGDLQIGDIQLQVLHTPGHSPGMVCFYWPQNKALFTGDLVFKDGFGRTDLPGGNSGQLKQSIAQVAQLSVDHLLPGHGDLISGADAVRANFEQISQVYMHYL